MSNNLNDFIICIDGLAASGKGTIAAGLMDTVGGKYFSTGEIYRYLTWKLIDSKSFDIEDFIVNSLAHYDYIEQFTLNLFAEFNHDILNELRHSLHSAKINLLVSHIAKIPVVRTLLLPVQQDYSKLLNNSFGIFDGRDIGTVIFPNAKNKIFITCDIDIRAKRRLKQMRDLGDFKITLNDIKNEITMRDRIDSSRDAAPLKIAEDSFIIDTSAISIKDAIMLASNFILGKRKSNIAS